MGDQPRGAFGVRRIPALYGRSLTVGGRSIGMTDAKTKAPEYGALQTLRAFRRPVVTIASPM